MGGPWGHRHQAERRIEAEGRGRDGQWKRKRDEGAVGWMTQGETDAAPTRLFGLLARCCFTRQSCTEPEAEAASGKKSNFCWPCLRPEAQG